MGTATRAALGLAVVLLSFSFSSSAHAQSKRPMPDYDGRPDRTTAGEVALWIPRVVLFPGYVVSEYVVRKPLGWFVTTSERKHWPAKFFNIFRGDEVKQSFGVVPTASLEFGFRPNAGVYVFLEDVFVSNNQMRFRFGFGGTDYLSVAALDRFNFGAGNVRLAARWIKRPDHVFFGIGPRARQEDKARFHATVLSVGPALTLRTGRHLSVTGSVGYRGVAINDGRYGDQPTIDEQVMAGIYDTPHGFPDGVRALYQRLELTADTRTGEPYKLTGLRASAYVAHAADVRDTPDQWISWGGQLGAFLDVTGTERVLGLLLSMDMAHELDGEVPFTELPELGGDSPMLGMSYNRVRGESTVAAALQYEWPIWLWVNAVTQVGFGNAFGPELEGFQPDLLRMSAAIGVRSYSSPDHQLQIIFGFATEPLADGFEVAAFRFAFGGTHGF